MSFLLILLLAATGIWRPTGRVNDILESFYAPIIYIFQRMPGLKNAIDKLWMYIYDKFNKG